MKKKLLMFLAVILLMAVSCKKSKNDPNEEATNGCLLTEMESVQNDGTIDSKKVYTYDSQGKLLAIAGKYDTWTYTYNADKIVVNRKRTDYSDYDLTRTYTLNSKGLIAHCVETDTKTGNQTTNGSYTYTYNAEGYLVSSTHTYWQVKSQIGAWATGVIQYTWSNGNLIKREGSSYGGTGITTYKYGTDIAPPTWPYGLDIVGFDDYLPSKYYGKQPKNIWEWGDLFSYTRDSKGNITSITSKFYIGVEIYTATTKYGYECR